MINPPSATWKSDKVWLDGPLFSIIFFFIPLSRITLCFPVVEFKTVYIYIFLQVAKFNPCSGEYLTHVDLPIAKVTSCCWAGTNYDELLVTSERLVVAQGLAESLRICAESWSDKVKREREILTKMVWGMRRPLWKVFAPTLLLR